MYDLGQRIRQLRKQRGITQAQLADGICTKSFVSQVEKGQANPSIDTLHAFAERLGVSLADLLGPGESRIPPTWIVEAIRDMVTALESGEHSRALHRGLVVLGRVYEMTGDKDEALEAYRKAAEMRGFPLSDR